MKINKKNALKLWEMCFGEKRFAEDFHGYLMCRDGYGDKDYYKCKYCRYVAPFSDIVTQNYTKSSYSNDLHKYVNEVDGLEYTFYEEHTFSNGVCTDCAYLHTHRYGDYLYFNARSHRRICTCGVIESGGHYVNASDITGGRYATCLGCNHLLDLQRDFANIIMSITQVSVNGSYILPSGIVVLVEEDIEAYLAGTLQFYHPADVPVTQ